MVSLYRAKLIIGKRTRAAESDFPCLGRGREEDEAVALVDTETLPLLHQEFTGDRRRPAGVR